MAYSIKTKEKAIDMRKGGNSYNDIKEVLGVSKGTLSRWLKDVELSYKAKKILANKIKKGQIKAMELKKKIRNNRKEKNKKNARKLIKNLKLDQPENLLICALLYYCEGDKDPGRVGFTNSDSHLVKGFLHLFRDSFKLDEKKFKGLIHIHDYHNEKEQIEFWSNITDIPKEQFHNSYHKKHTKKRIRKNYQGCISVRYYDTNIARKLISTARTFLKGM